MNRDEPEKTDKECNVCDTGVVEVGSAWSRCSNRGCLTRERDNNLSTDSTPEEVAEYWKDRALTAEGRLDDALHESEIRMNALDAFEDFIEAESRVDAEEAEIRCDTYLEHLDVGWGWLKEESDAV